MQKFWAFVAGYKRFAIAALAVIAEFGGLIPAKYQGAAVITTAVLVAGTRVVDTIQETKEQ
tara:strand:- start:15488 stop:15670 length:183 start_codon:yes stop_codon:yes gene_type:complete